MKVDYQLENGVEGIIFHMFCGGKRDRTEGMLWEGDGFLILYKRLEGGVFQWPRTTVKPYSRKAM